MANRPAPIKQVDVTRSIKGAMAAGISPGRIEVDQLLGKITIYPMGTDAGHGIGPDPDEFLQR